MASRRKSTTPCMVAPVEIVDSDPDMEVVTEGDEEAEGGAADCSVENITESKSSEDDTQAIDHFIKNMDSSMAEGGYECKYCSFQTSQLNMFTLHVDTEHPNIVLNSSYVCVECDFHTKRYDALLEHNARHHPGEDNFTRTMVKRNNQTIFEQRVNDLTFDGGFVKVEEDEDTSCKGIALSKTPIMKLKSKADAKKFAGSLKMADLNVIKVESDVEDETEVAPPPGTPTVVAVSTPMTVQPIQQSIMVNSPSMLQIKTTNSNTMLPPGTLAQVLSALQNQQASQTQLLIPVSSIPTYNGAMDNNVLLVSAYNRFPYPSVSEIMGLAAQTKFTEEQIKVWFSAQRLKHGVSWTPEEVEEARRKKFNGSVQQVPQTITVIPANFATAANGLQSIFQTCQIVGQPGMVLTQVGGGGNAVPVASPITLTVAGVTNPRTSASKVPDPSTSDTASPLSPDPLGARPKKSKEQLAELKASYLRRQFATEAEISRLMKVTNLTKRAIKKWFSDTRYNQRNSKDHHGVALNDIAVSANSNEGSSAIVIDSSDEAGDSSPTTQGPIYDPRIKFRHAFPDFTPQKFKEKTPEQLLLLEASYQKSDKPSDEELSRLRMETKLTRREVDAWFSERRKMPADLKDGTEEAKGDRVKGPSSGQEPQTLPSGRKIMKKTPEQLHILKSAFVRTQWPSAEEYDKMAEESGLPRTYIVNWFGDTRYACKNSNLKWYYLYQSGKGDVTMNGGGLKKKPRKRFRGWSRRTRRPYPCKQTPPAIKVKTGKDILKEHYLKNNVLNEKDLDELVAKSSMSYEQVRDWFAEISRREENGLDPFSDVEKQTHVEGEGEMEVKEQGGDVANEEHKDNEDNSDEDENNNNNKDEDEINDSETREEPQCINQSQPEAEEQ
ncbi:zinc fingers and homeoboxes protein 1 [Esox lucius]|uniref:Zinc fingers and homeoboxes protein 1 n=1 Tax=Esox lucius TaxID=8010 RepID=A0A3P8YQM8_ESOLU|nr:zinc fingers and homeoboxes protein 1 [Esox lucius]XP_010898798.2 zinc fingers and homeoboxes protein 1 [Esox lucius]XP_010898800.2 zinc fingers and homeoboxes protein 1 [Esox lucius]XP_010898801.2 zinc fingers and homeoboxes protein 1 [Esox lucius]